VVSHLPSQRKREWNGKNMAIGNNILSRINHNMKEVLMMILEIFCTSNNTVVRTTGNKNCKKMKFLNILQKLDNSI
jgi:hypothetical protein